jgi:hypothetical protein
MGHQLVAPASQNTPNPFLHARRSLPSIMVAYYTATEEDYFGPVRADEGSKLPCLSKTN